MAIKLASLFFEIAAKSDKLTAELTKSKKNTNAWAKESKEAAARVTDAFKRVSLGAGVLSAGLTAMYVSNSSALDSLGKTAAKLGDTTQDLKVFGLAAEYGGVGVDSANVALQRMTRRMAEAANGTGEARGAVAELGLDAERLAKMRPSQAFEEIATALGDIPDASDRVRLAMKFFDSEGVALVNVTRDVLQKAREDVDALGGALTSIEVAQIEAANDSVGRLGAGFDLLTDKLTVRMAPAVQAVADQLFESAKQGAQLDETLDTMAASATSAIADLARSAGSVLKFIDGRDELATGGLVGYLLGGKMGFLVGTAVSSTFETVSATFDYYKSRFDLTLSDAEKAEIALKKIVAEIDLLKSPVGLLNLNRDEDLAMLEEQRREVATILSDMGEFDRIAVSVFEQSNGAASVLGDTLNNIADALDNSTGTIAGLAAAPLIAPGGILPPDSLDSTPTGAVGTDSPAANDLTDDSNWDNYLTLQAQKEQSERDHLARMEEYRAQYFAGELYAAEYFQKTWTMFEEAGAKDRLKILGRETSGALSTLSEHSRTMFELNKAIGLANATVYIAEGIAASWKLGWPMGAVAAATVALEGAAQIRAITSAKFGKAEVTQPGTSSSGSIPDITSDVSSANSGIAANDPDAVGTGSLGGGTAIFAFHTPGASDEQKADELAQMLKVAQDNDLLVPNSNGGFDYTGTGSSTYQPASYEAVA